MGCEGVRFAHDDGTFQVYARREVIISAGAVQSPQLLELSGIGNRTVLSKAGIPTRVHNPNVGENLQDHISKIASHALFPGQPAAAPNT